MSALTLPAARRWMRESLRRGEHRDECDEIDYTSLATACAEAHGIDGLRGPLDDPNHWIWDAAVAAALEVQP